MSSSGGSAAIREAIENKRAKIKAPGESLKTLSRDAKRKKAWYELHDMIRVVWWRERLTLCVTFCLSCDKQTAL